MTIKKPLEIASVIKSEQLSDLIKTTDGVTKPGGTGAIKMGLPGGPANGPLGGDMGGPEGGPGGPEGGPHEGGPGGRGGAPKKIVPGKAEGRVWGYSGPGDWLGEAPVIEKWDEEHDVDVVVLGSGNAGVQAALAAAECGAKVAVVEKQEEDVFAWYGEDMACYNAKFTIDAGFGPYDLGEIVNEYVIRSGGRCNPDIVKAYVHNSGETLDHMLDVAKEMGVDPRCYTYDTSKKGWVIIHANMDYDKYLETGDVHQSLQHNYPLTPGTKSWAGACQFMGIYNEEPIVGCAANSVLPILNEAMVAKAKELNADWYFGTAGVVLIQNDKGDVIGLFAREEKTGKIIRFNTAKGVVMAGGDYAANAEMCWALLNEYMERRERAGGTQDAFFSFMGGRTGDSVKMMCWAGGFIDPAPRGTMLLGGGPTGPWGANSMLWLNCKGHRFTNEGNISAAQTAISRQPVGKGCLVTDRKWLKSVCASGVEHGGPNCGRPDYYQDMIDGMNAIQPGPQGGRVKNCTIAERSYDRVICANTLEELAGYLGYDEAGTAEFLESIRRYNELCYKGRDEDYGKDASAMIPVDEAPFYGISSSMGSDGQCGPSMVTMSGIMTDRDLNVIDVNKDPIKGLYACGNSLGGRYGLGYSTPSAGNSIGMAMTHGRLAGKNVCK